MASEEFQCLGPFRHKAVIAWRASPPQRSKDLEGILRPQTLNTVPRFAGSLINNAGFAFQLEFQDCNRPIEINVINTGMNCNCSRGHTTFACGHQIWLCDMMACFCIKEMESNLVAVIDEKARSFTIGALEVRRYSTHGFLRRYGQEFSAFLIVQLQKQRLHVSLNQWPTDGDLKTEIEYNKVLDQLALNYQGSPTSHLDESLWALQIWKQARYGTIVVQIWTHNATGFAKRMAECEGEILQTVVSALHMGALTLGAVQNIFAFYDKILEVMLHIDNKEMYPHIWAGLLSSEGPMFALSVLESVRGWLQTEGRAYRDWRDLLDKKIGKRFRDIKPDMRHLLSRSVVDMWHEQLLRLLNY